MIATVTPSVINGTVTAPASKSAMQRACALALLNNGTTIIQNAGKSNDDLAALDIIRKAGALMEEDKDGNLLITSNGNISLRGALHCGESGLSLRMFTPIVALSNEEVMIYGEGSLLQRPINFFDTVLPLLQVKIQTNNGFLPLKVQGPLIPTDISIDGSMSSQYLTGLLFAFAKAAKSNVTISVHDLKSKPYVDLSLQMLQHFGYTVSNKGYVKFKISAMQEERREINYYNEGDWSGGAFILIAGAIAGNVTVHGLFNESVQADKAILEVLKNCGAGISVYEHHITITHSKELKPFTFDATDCPDLFPPLAALAAYCNGTSVIKGTSRLLAKESNRAASLTDVFTKMGVDICIRGDEMTIVGGKKMTGAQVDAHHDHRIVMACAVAALSGSGDVVINGAEAVEKSYPDFFDHLRMLGAVVSLA